MNNNKSTVRLIYPQWQGGDIAHWMPDIPSEDSSRGYYLGARFLNMLAPEAAQKILEVPVSLDINRTIEKGILGRTAILNQTQKALDILEKNNPERIVTLGGECSVSVVPFSYLAKKYNNDVAMVWIDAHPDVNLPFDEYKGYHAMAVTALIGMGDEELVKMLPSTFDSSKILIVGLRSWDKGMKERQEKLKIKGISPKCVEKDSTPVLDWLKTTGDRKSVV